jgi:hypothetical protein
MTLAILAILLATATITVEVRRWRVSSGLEKILTFLLLCAMAHVFGTEVGRLLLQIWEATHAT